MDFVSEILNFSIIDVLDIILVASLLYYAYKLLKGTVHGDRKYLDPSSASIEIDKEILPMSKVLSNEGTHGTENRGPVRENLKK